MNRRSFFGKLGAAVAGFTILPGAGRVWKAVRPGRSPFWHGMDPDSVYCSNTYTLTRARLNVLTPRQIRDLFFNGETGAWAGPNWAELPPIDLKAVGAKRTSLVYDVLLKP